MASGPFSAKVARDSLSLYTVTLYPKGQRFIDGLHHAVVINLMDMTFQHYF